MTRYFADLALLPDGWAGNVIIAVDEAGNISEVLPGAGSADLEGAVALSGPVMPGMANLHSHAFQRAMAGLAERSGRKNDDFWTWRETMYAFAGRLTPELQQDIATGLYVEMLKAGYTAVGEFQYIHNAPDGTPYDDPAEMTLRCLAAARSAGIGITLLPVFYANGGFAGVPPAAEQARFALSPDAVLTIVDTARRHAAGAADVRIGVAPHSLRAVTPESLSEVVAGVQSDDTMTPVHIHVAEQTAEVEACLAWSHQRPVDWLLSHAPVDGRWCLIHATHMVPGEIRALSASDAVAGLCPTTEANLGDGLFPLADYLATGGKFGIGSDSHISVNAAEELRLLDYGQRLTTRRRLAGAHGPNVSSGESLLQRALDGGAQAMGREIGRIQVGCRADLLTLDSQVPILAGTPRDSYTDSLIFALPTLPVRDVYVGGKNVVSNGRHIREDEVVSGYRTALKTLREAG